jgi:hypothetical protein
MLFLLFCFFSHAVFSQKNSVEIKDGSHFEYLFNLHGQKRPIGYDLNLLTDAIQINWELRGIKGTYTMPYDGLDNGSRLYVKQPEPFETVKLSSDETICFISRSAFQNLIEQGKFVYNQTTYVLVPLKEGNRDMFEVNGKELPVIHVKAQIDETEMWILENPEFPLVCKLYLNPLGVDYTITKIEL